MVDVSKAVLEASFGTLEQLPPSDSAEIAFSGRSNVGKSSLINRLLNRRALARVSSVPGKTVTVNFYSVGDVRFADLPGYGYARAARSEKLRWSRLAEGYFRSDRDIRLVVQLIDMRRPPTADDLAMLDFLKQSGLPFAVALTKSDKLNRTEYAERLKSIKDELPGVAEEDVIPFSSVSGEGRNELLGRIGRALDKKG